MLGGLAENKELGTNCHIQALTAARAAAQGSVCSVSSRRFAPEMCKNVRMRVTTTDKQQAINNSMSLKP